MSRDRLDDLGLSVGPRGACSSASRISPRQPGGAVLDGRDIGTVIAPDADVKLFVTATPEVRAQRRVRELQERGMPAHYDDVLADIRARDERDTHARRRAAEAGAPMRCCSTPASSTSTSRSPRRVRLVEQKLAPSDG